MPDKLKRRVKNYAKEGAPFEKTEFLIYSKEEADEAGIAYTHWRDCKDIGDWGLTDDGFVVMMRKPPSEFRGVTTYLFSIGGVPVTKANKSVLRYLERKKNRCYTYSGELWHEKEVRNTRTKAAMQCYVTEYIANGGHVGQAERARAGALLGGNRPKHLQAAQFAMILRTESGQKLFKEMLDKALKDAGITYESVLEKMEETYEEAKSNSHTQVMRGISGDMYKMLRDSEASSPAEASEKEFDITLLSRQVDLLEAPEEIDYVEVGKESIQEG